MKPSTEQSREIAEELGENSIEGALSFCDRVLWMDPMSPQRIGVEGVHYYLGHSKPESFVLEDIFVFSKLEGTVFSKHEIRDMTERLLRETDEDMPVVEELLDTGGFVKNALGYVFQPSVPENLTAEIEEMPDWVGGIVIYKQPSDRMIGPKLQDLSAHEFGKQFTDGGEVLVFQPSNERLRQLLAGLDINAQLK